MLHVMLHRVNPHDGMSDPIVIRKYENRRLYDTRHSRYVNLAGVAEMVRDGRDIQVLDSKTGEDITRHVLAQIIVDDAKDPDQGPPLEFLRDLVRARDQAGREFFHWYLRSASEIWEQMRSTMRRRPFTPDLPWMRLWEPGGMAEEMQARMRQQMEALFGGSRPPATGGSSAREPNASHRQTASSRATASPAPPEPQPAGGARSEAQEQLAPGTARAELDELKGRLRELERRLADDNH